MEVSTPNHWIAKEFPSMTFLNNKEITTKMRGRNKCCVNLQLPVRTAVFKMDNQQGPTV